MLIVNFLRGLFDANGSVSSKRVAGIEVLQLVIAMTIGEQFFHFKINTEIFWVLIGFVLTCFGMNTYTTIKGMKVKSDVASEVVDSNQPNANAQAAEILQATKP